MGRWADGQMGSDAVQRRLAKQSITAHLPICSILFQNHPFERDRPRHHQPGRERGDQQVAEAALHLDPEVGHALSTRELAGQRLLKRRLLDLERAPEGVQARDVTWNRSPSAGCPAGAAIVTGTPSERASRVSEQPWKASAAATSAVRAARSARGASFKGRVPGRCSAARPRRSRDPRRPRTLGRRRRAGRVR